MRSPNALALSGAEWTANTVDGLAAADVVLQHYDRERISLQRFVRFGGADPETACDVVQDAFLKLHEHLLRGGDASNLRAWLYRVAHNLALNWRSAAAVSKGASLAAVPEPISADRSPEQEFLNRERDLALQAAVQSLGRVQRDCMVLRAQGFRYREIGEILQMSTSSVGEQVQRAIEQLRTVL